MGANIIFCTFPDDIKREREIFILMDGLGVAIIKTQIQKFFAGSMKCLGCHECRWGERRQITNTTLSILPCYQIVVAQII